MRSKYTGSWAEIEKRHPTDCQVCGSPFGDDVFYHSDGNLEGVDSICSDCDSRYVRLVTEDDDE